MALLEAPSIRIWIELTERSLKILPASIGFREPKDWDSSGMSLWIDFLCKKSSFQEIQVSKLLERAEPLN